MKFYSKKLKKFFAMICAFCLIVEFSLSGIPVKAAEPTPKVTYTVTGEATVGKQITINLNVSNISGLYGGSWDFAYDPSILKIDEITSGELTSSIPQITTSNKSGHAYFWFTKTGSTTGVSTTEAKSIAKIKATVLKEGSVNINTTYNDNLFELSNKSSLVKLSNKNGDRISYISDDTSFITKQFYPVTISSVSVDKKSPQAPNSSITFTANASGGTSLLYQFLINDGSGWKVLRDYSSSKSFTWKPANVGSYKISVYVKDVNSSNSVDAFNVMNYSIINIDPVTISSISVDKKSPQAPNSSITFTANASGGTSLLYQFLINDGSGWKVLRDYSSSKSFTWKPANVGSYKISVYVKDVNSSNSVDAFNVMNYSIINIDPVTISSISVDKKSPQAPNSSITFTANASGGTSLLYQFLINDGSGWKVLRDYSSSKSFTWKPTNVGSYKISAYVKDVNSSNSVDAFNVMNYSIINIDPVTISSISVDKKSPQAPNSSITFTANASGGTSLLYQFLINDGSGWKVLRDYSSSKSFTWKPTNVGSYKISAYVKDVNSSNSVDAFNVMNYSIINIDPVTISSISVDKKSPQAPNSSITFTANASGGTSLLYQFLINDGSGWKVLRDYSSSKSFTWKPTNVGSYKISAYVKDVNSSNSVDAFKLLEYTIV